MAINLSLPQNWLFYSEDLKGVETIHAEKKCIKPERTKIFA